MSVKLFDRIKQVTLTEGTGTISLSSTPAGFQSFSNVFSNDDQTYYVIENKNTWEVGRGRYNNGTITREEVLDSSNSGQRINLSGKSNVFVTLPADKIVFTDESGRSNLDVDYLNNVRISSLSSGQNLTYNGQYWVNTTPDPGYSDEQAQDAVSSLLVAGTGIQLNYNDSGNALSIDAYGILPTGGSAGQILSKTDATNYNTEWIDNYAKEVVQYVKNSTHTTLSKGQVVYINGADGTNPTIGLAIASGESTSSKTLGFLKQDLNHGDFGYVVTEGFLDGLNTNGATTEGDPIWLSPSVSGGVVYGLANKPYAPNHLVFLGYVIRKNTNNGRIYVKIQNGFELKELHDVVAQSPNDGDIIRYVSSSGLWSAQPMPVGYTDENAQDAVGGIVQNSSNVSLSYNDNTPSLLADLVDTSVVAGGYGSTSQVATFTVDAKGRLTAAGNATITPSSIGALGSLNGLTGSTQTFATGTSGSDFNIVSSGTAHTFNLPDASATARGVVTTGTQRFAGIKYFDSADIRFGTGINDYRISVAGDLYIDANIGRAIFRTNNSTTVNLVLTGQGGIRIGDNVVLIHDAGHILAQRNSTNAQMFRLYNTFTDSSNYERLALQFGTFSSARHAQIAAESAGTGTANINLVLTPRGAGALIAGPPPDGTTTGGNARGANAVDLQTLRNAATQVASGPNSIAIGVRNSASVDGAISIGDGNTNSSLQGGVAIGYQNNCTSQYWGIAIGGRNTVSSNGYNTAIGSGCIASASFTALPDWAGSATAIGENCTATRPSTLATGTRSVANRWGQRAHATSRFAVNGDCQLGEIVLRGITTTNAAVRLRPDGNTARVTIASGQICQYLLIITGVRQGGSQVATYMRKVCIKNIGGTTTLVGNVETIGTDLAVGTSLSITADDVNDDLAVEATGVLNQNWRWNCVVYGGEISHE